MHAERPFKNKHACRHTYIRTHSHTHTRTSDDVASERFKMTCTHACTPLAIGAHSLSISLLALKIQFEISRSHYTQTNEKNKLKKRITKNGNQKR